MFRRSQLQAVETIDELRSKHLKKFTDVYTSDGERIGIAIRFVHRPIEEVNEAMRLYRSYLVLQSIVLGGTTFVPTVYIDNYDPANNRLTLAATMNTLNEETWNREPDFVARGEGVYEELAE